MSFKGNLTGRKAIGLQSKGQDQEALAIYQQAMAEGMDSMRYILAYSVLLLRLGRFEEAKDLLVKYQKAPMTPDQKQQLFMNYAVCAYKLGNIEKALVVLEGQYAKNPSGMIYSTLGYLYVEAGDFEKAKEFNEKALDYDDEDSICLDNMGQTYYRLGGDKAKALEYFQKAHELKPSQIDTLYFLAQYDIEAGKKEEAKKKLEKALEGRTSPLNYATPERIQAALEAL
ncbi:MAG: tetratricopeptide repeat protein [Clostridia bacterium]|nr:tetratricopeptide repeat protein [Clostridia bacterium]